MAKPVKILVCGDVEGKFDMLYKRVEEVNSQHGPFDVLFCVGQFFCSAEYAVDLKGAEDEESMAWITGRRTPPVPTFFIDGGSGSDVLDSMVEGGDLCPGIVFLGKRGIQTIFGLKIAYLSGIADPLSYRSSSMSGVQNYTETDVKYIRTEAMKEAGIDVLLTNDWTKGVFKKIPLSSIPPVFKQPDSIGSAGVAELARDIKPRYHFSALLDQWFQRPPYTNLPSSSTPPQSAVTRFLGLAKVHEENKINRFLYAANLVPISKMTPEQIIAQPAGTTPCPFMDQQPAPQQMKRPRDAQSSVGGPADSSSGGFLPSPSSQDGLLPTPQMPSRQFNPQQQNKRPRQEDSAPPPCWFCLSSPQVEKHLIVSIGDESYVTLAKGPVVDENLIITPIQHAVSLSTMASSVSDEIEKYISAFRKAFEAQGKGLIVYERNLLLRSPHCILQAIAIPSSVSVEETKAAFIENSKALGMDLIACGSASDSMQSSIQGLLKDGAPDAAAALSAPYFLVQLQDGSKYAHKLDPKVKIPLPFGRDVCANTLLKVPERVDWKACKMTKEEEVAIVDKLKETFKPFDFTE